MGRHLGILRGVARVIAIFAAIVFLPDTKLPAQASTARPLLVAHRGLGQTLHSEGLMRCFRQGSFGGIRPGKLAGLAHILVESVRCHIEAVRPCGRTKVQEYPCEIGGIF